MKNVLKYYYNLDPVDIHQKDDIYFFKIDNFKYYMHPVICTDNELKEIFEINRELLLRNFPVHQIILNKNNDILIQHNGINYVLLKTFIKENTLININDLSYLANNTPVIKIDSTLNKSNWTLLWERKNDYLEYQISQFGINYPVVVECFAYYIGLAENAISYAKNTTLEAKSSSLDKLVICHRRVSNNTTIFDLLNPLYFVIDYKIRDIAEYIKFKFFYNRVDIWEEIHKYFYSTPLSLFGVRMFFARLLYPTYFFDKYDEILEGTASEEEIVSIIEKQEEYEEFLIDIYSFLKLNYNIPEIEWLIKR